MSEIRHGSTTRRGDSSIYDSYGQEGAGSGTLPIVGTQNRRNSGALGPLAGNQRTTAPRLPFQANNGRRSVPARQESPYQPLPPRVGQTLEQSETKYANGEPVWRLVVADESDCHFRQNGIPVKRVFGKGTTEESTAPVRRDVAVSENERRGPREGMPIQIHFARPVDDEVETREGEEIHHGGERVQTDRGANSAPANLPRTEPGNVPLNQANRAQQGDPDTTARVQNVGGGVPISPVQQAEMQAQAMQIFKRKLEDAGLGPRGAITDPTDRNYWTNFSQQERDRVPALMNAAIQEAQAAYLGQAQDGQDSLLARMGNLTAQNTGMLQYEMQLTQAFLSILKAVGHLIAEAAKAH